MNPVTAEQQATVDGDRRSGRERLVSMLDGIRPYQRGWLQTDIVAGITLAALAIPEVMGYTKIAGMPVVGSIVASWALDLQRHGVSTLGPVPSGLPSIGLPRRTPTWSGSAWPTSRPG
jgi:MFS superfamily sulfate permease-like transporter